jgi:hypothetical protein
LEKTKKAKINYEKKDMKTIQKVDCGEVGGPNGLQILLEGLGTKRPFGSNINQ